ncbi:MAG: hypothetical protein FJZ47_23155 [Candidatus Tectomicrobia bacterium]|uniref:Uncharacterized protein n=1 Tax=Tectimicrobiota bacterium TaxID=2528274 RepID=A0A937W736_UNCTE|nr:hypothetical protein [Candidatus Tectomicrobia bacterium]
MTCCPNLAWPARGQTGQGNLGIHSQQEHRFICTQCGKTCTATQGPAWYRLRTSAETSSLVVTLRAQGCPRHAMVVACGSDERTVASWLARDGRHGQAVQEHRGAPPRALGQVLAAAIRVTAQGRIVWMALAMRVQTRVGLGGEASEPRDLARRRRPIARVKRCAAPGPCWLGTAGVVSSLRARRETVRAPVHPGHGGRPRRRPWRQGWLAQVVKRDERRRVVETERRMVDGTPARVETLRRRSQGDGVMQTADIARLHATVRARLASLTRRGRALARQTAPCQHGRSLIGTVSHCCTPHARLAPARGKTTPARAAGITDHGWSVHARLSSRVPPPPWTPPKRRGRPSYALKRLIARWCGDHG